MAAAPPPGLALSAADRDAPGDALPRPYEASYWLLPGRVLGSIHPGAPSRLQALAQAGVSATVDLTSAADPTAAYAPLDAAGHPGLRLNHPITDFGVPSLAQMQAIEADVRRLLAQGRVLAIHCRAGIGRTGTLAACLLVSAGLDAEAALATLARKFAASAQAQAGAHSPETAAQREFVRLWAAQRA